MKSYLKWSNNQGKQLKMQCNVENACVNGVCKCSFRFSLVRIKTLKCLLVTEWFGFFVMVLLMWSGTQSSLTLLPRLVNSSDLCHLRLRLENRSFSVWCENIFPLTKWSSLVLRFCLDWENKLLLLLWITCSSLNRVEMAKCNKIFEFLISLLKKKCDYS